MFALVILLTIGALSIFSGRALFGQSGGQAPTSATPPQSARPTIERAKRLGPVRSAAAPDLAQMFSWKMSNAFSPGVFFVPTVTAVKSATLATDVNGNGIVNPGDTLMYSIVVSNTAAPGAGNDALNVVFTDQLNTNLTLSGAATASPIARPDIYGTIGNTQLQVAAAQTIASPGLFVNGNVLSNDIDPQGGALTVTPIVNGATTAGGTVTLNANGTFIYTPQAGDLNVADTFTYTVTEPDGKTDTATVTINIANALVWYVKNDAAAGGLGRSGDPFDTLVEAQTASAANDIIYVFAGNGLTTGQNSGIALKAGQRLIGEGVALTVPVSVNGGPNPTVLRAAGSQPMLDNTTAGGSAVSATNVIPAEIAGLNLAGNTNGIDVTLTGALTGTLLIHDNTVRAAGVEGIDINSATTGALTLSVYENLLTSTGTALDIERTMGTLTIVAFHDNMVSGNTGGSGIVVTGTGGVVIFDTVPGGAINPVPGGATVIGALGNGVGVNGMVLTNVTGELSFANAVMGTIGAGDLDIFADGGAALSVTGGAGGFNFSVTLNAGTLVATGGPAASISTANINLQLNTLTSTNSASTGVSLTTVTGTFSAPSGSSITNAGTTDFNISGGTANVTYNGTITDDVGQLVSVANTTGGTKSFTGAITDGNDGDGSGISLTNNTGATITFNGGLTLSTGANAAFTATGGGTVNVCDDNPCNPGATGALVNTLTTTTGTTLNVANTTIGANNLEFKSISANGAANGIVLNTTGASGSLVVKGNGNTAVGGDNSGGEIQNTTNAAISLTSTLSPSFTNLNIHNIARSGVDGQQVTNFTFKNSKINIVGTAAAGQHEESNIAFNDGGVFTSNSVSGTVSITQNQLTNARRHGIQIENGTGTISNLTITNNTLTSSTSAASSLGTAILVLTQGSASLTAHLTTGTISNNTVTNFPSGEGIAILGGSGNGSNNTSATLGANGTPINITNNTISGQAAAGQHTGSNAIRVSMNSQVGVMNVNVSCNGNTTSPCTAAGQITNVEGQTVSAFAGGSITGTTTIDNNVSVLNHTIMAGTAGIAVQVDDGPAGLGTSAADYNFNITNNKVSQYDGFGIRAIARASNGKMDLTIQNNQVGSTIQLTNRNAIRVDSGSATGDVTLCMNMTGNAGIQTAAPGTEPLVGSGVNAGIGLRKQGTVAGTNEFGIVGIGSSPTNAQVQAFVGSPVPPGLNNTTAAGGVAGSNANGNGVDIISGSNFLSCTQTSLVLAPAPKSTSAAQPDNVIAATPGGDDDAKLVKELFEQLVGSEAIWLKYFSAPSQLSACTSLPLTLADYLKFSDKPASVTAVTEPPTQVAPPTTSGGATRITSGQPARLILSAFAAPMSYINPLKLFEGSVAAAESKPTELTATRPAPARTLLINSKGEYRIVPTAALAGELITINGAGSGFLLPAGESTTIMFNAQIAAGFTGTSITNQANVTAAGGINVNSNNLSTPVVQAPTISKAFSPATIATNGISTLTFTLTNTNPSQALSGVAFSDTFPAGLSVDTTPTLVNGCGGTFTPALAGGQTSVSYSGGSLGSGVGTNCTISFKVKGTTDGAKPNTTGIITATQTNTGATSNTATLNVINAPTFTKSFTPTSIPINTNSTLSFTIINNSPNFSLSGVGFIDTLPAGVVVAAAPNISGTCFGGTITAVAAAGTVSLSGAAIPASGSCTFSVSVTGTTAGTKNNIVTLSTTELGTNSSAAQATATLTVVGPPTVAKSFVAAVNIAAAPTGATEAGTTVTITTTAAHGFSPNQPVTIAGVAVAGYNGNFTIINTPTPTTFTYTNPTAGLGASGGGTAASGVTSTSIPIGTNINMRFLLTNPNSGTSLTGVGFQDSLPAGISVVSFGPSQCGGTVSGTSSSVTLSGGTLGTGGSSTCTVSVMVMGAQAGSWNNTATNVTSTEGGPGANSNQATLIVLARPTVTKIFSPALIAANGTSTLTITLGNTNSVALTGAAVTDTLPAGVTTTAPAAATNCGGTAGNTSNSVSLTGGTIPANGTCTLTVGVTSSSTGAYTNTIAIGGLTTNNGGSNTVAGSATLTVGSPPSIAKAFSPNPIAVGGVSTLTFTVTNPNSGLALNGIAFSDTFPAGLQVAATPNVTTTGCGSPTFAPAAGNTSVSFSGGAIAVSGTCTATVNVTATTTGAKVNTTGNVSSTNGGTGNTGSATLNVFAPPTITKAFSPTSIAVNGISTLTITITNPVGNPAGAVTGVSVSDTFPAGLEVDATPGATNTCGGTFAPAATNTTINLTGGTIATAGGSCAISVKVKGTTGGAKMNTTGAVSSTQGGTGLTASATLNVFAPATVVKSFTPASVSVNGVSTLTITITNPAGNAGGLTSLSFTDTFPAGVVVDTTPAPSNTCGGTFTAVASATNISLSNGAIATPGNSCSVSANVKATTSGAKVNNVIVNSTEGGASAQASATLTVTLTGTTTTGAIINELRTSGPLGPGDDFIELYNNTNSPILVQASDASAGWAVVKSGATCASAPILVATIPNGTLIPARGSYLLVGSQYSLANYGGTGAAAGDQILNSDLENDVNVGLFNSATTFTAATRLDAVGFGLNTVDNCDTLREGNTLAPAEGSTSQYSFVRKIGAGGLPQDTNNNSADFAVVSTTPTVAVGSNATPILGAPGPENTFSPLQRTSLFAVGLIEPNALSTDPPNRVRDTNQTALITAPNAGTMEIRRRYTNNTGGAVTRLRFRITGITTLNSPVIYTGQADIRSLSSSDFAILTSLGSLTVKGTFLEAPSDQSTTGGGLNSSLTVMLGSPLANGQSLDVNFLLGIKTNGRFAFNITIEALP
jgi:uncharacterized repeat protein (TIGR01451 family)